MLDEYRYGYYQTLRLESRDRVVKALNRRIKTESDRQTWKGVTLASITNDALEYSRIHWPKGYNGELHQPLPKSWEKLMMSYSNVPANFNIAVWQEIDGEKYLQGLALGRPSGSKKKLSINWLERSFVEPCFKGGVLLPILASAEEFAKLLGANCVEIKNAIDAAVFAQYGYAPIDGAPNVGNRLRKEL